MKNKLSRAEKSWILYDVGNSAFILMVSTLIPIYFNHLAELAGMSSVTYLAYWGYAVSAATLMVAVFGPILGAIADNRNIKVYIFVFTAGVGIISCFFLGVWTSWVAFIIIFVIAKIGYSLSVIIYDSMINDITSEDRLDEVSSLGYAWGYIGSCVPFVLSLGIVLTTGITGLSTHIAMAISFVIVGVWWLITTLPLLKNYQQIHFVENQKVSSSLIRLAGTFAEIKEDRRLLFFLLSYFLYIDGVYTIIEMATAYGKTLSIDSTGLLIALLVTQVVAFPSAIIFGRLSKKYSSERLIPICILAYTVIALFALFMSNIVHFFILAICVGMFQGGIQAMSRSHFAKLIQADRSGEYFGIMDICGKGASVIGTSLVAVVSQITGSANIGISVLAILFVLGLLMFRVSVSSGDVAHINSESTAL